MTPVVQILTRLGSGGPPVLALAVNRELERRGIPSLLVCGTPDCSDGDMSYLLRPSDRIARIPEMSRRVAPWSDLVAVARLAALLRRVRPLVVHTHTAKAGALGRIAARIAGVPVVVHTFHGNVCRHYFGPLASAAIRTAERALAAISDAVCVLSEQQRTELCDELAVVPPGKATVMPIGLDLAPMTGVAPPPSGGPFTAGWFGRFVPVKDIPLLLSVMRNAPSGMRFLIAGDGPERAAVESFAASGVAGCEYLGWRRDLAPVIARCHVLLQTSRNEGTPVALIEGMAAGRPFVSTPAGGVVDLVHGSGFGLSHRARWFDNAVLAEPSPDAFAGALTALASDGSRLRRMAAAASAFASRFTLDALAGSLESLYRSLLLGKGLASRLAHAPQKG